MTGARRWFVAAVVLVFFVAPASGQGFDAWWVAEYDGTGNSLDEGWQIAVDDAGNVYMCGGSLGAGTGFDYATIKYDANGNEQWVARYNGPASLLDEAYDIAVDDAGNAYVTGRSTGDGSGCDYATIKYDTYGNEEWVARYDGPGNDYDWAWAIAVDEAGYVYVTGRSTGDGTSLDYATIKYDPDGNEVWVARYDGPGSSDDWSNSLALDDEGYVYVSGRSFGAGTKYDYATIKYDPGGNEEWVARYDGPISGSDGAWWGIAVDADGCVYVTGESQSELLGINNDFATVKYDPDGNEEWVARYNGTADAEDDGYDITLGPDGSVFVVGRSRGPGSHFDYATIKYDADGSEEWVTRYDGPGSDWDCPHSIAADGVGNVYVAGASVGAGTMWDCTTVKYDALGNEEWVARLNGTESGDDWVWGMAVGPGDCVHVTGYCWNSGNSRDFVTAKYSPVSGVTAAEERWPALSPCSPNPFTLDTTIHFEVGDADRLATLAIYNVRGQLVRMLADGPTSETRRAALWDGTDEAGLPVSAGVYLVRLEVGAVTKTEKVVLVR